MAERKRISGTDNIEYEGFFDLKKTFKVLIDWFTERGYERHDQLNAHNAMESGNEMSLYLIFFKKISDYAKVQIDIFISVYNAKDIEVQVDKHKERMQQGKIKLSFDCFLITDYENKWESQPMMFFLRTVFDKFFFKIYTYHYEEEAREDGREAMHEVKSFLNLHKYLAA
ncbi:MAG: hypothetical protein V1725_07400 [archaeon]